MWRKTWQTSKRINASSDEGLAWELDRDFIIFVSSKGGKDLQGRESAKFGGNLIFSSKYGAAHDSAPARLRDLNDQVFISNYALETRYYKCTAER